MFETNIINECMQLYNKMYLGGQFSFSVCFCFLATILQVHTVNAVGRTVETLENWLHLQPYQLPRSAMLNAFLHFEALSDHDYSFSCVLCGYFPPLVNLDVNSKGVFELAGEKS